MTGKSWEHRLEKQVFDALNEIETEAGRPIPPVMRSEMHAAISRHVAKMQQVSKERKVAAVGTLFGWLASVLLIPAPSIWWSVAKGFLLGTTGLNAFFLGRRHEHVKSLEGQAVGVRFMGPEE